MKWLSRWNAPLGVPHVVALGLLLVISMLLWFSAILPRLDAVLKPMEEHSPFAYEVLRSAVAFLMLPGSFILPFIALYLLPAPVGQDAQPTQRFTEWRPDSTVW